MTDIATQYVLTTPGGTITLNDGTLGDGTDKYWLTRPPQGLNGTLRTPFDNVPFGNGGIAHTSLGGPTFPVFDGMYLIESSTNQGDCQELRNELAANLKAALDSIVSPTSGTLAWTPTGQGAESLTVFYWVVLDDADMADDYYTQNFSFGLFSETSSI